jgi:hypothetical protein
VEYEKEDKEWEGRAIQRGMLSAVEREMVTPLIICTGKYFHEMPFL